MAGRPRKPLAYHQATGATAKNPQRFRDREEEPRPALPLGQPPAEFLNPKSPTALAMLGIWHELVAQAVEGVLTGSDRLILENACRLQYVIRRDLRPGSGHLAQMKAYLSELGMTPAGRTRVNIRKAKEVDGRSPEGWAALAEERSAARLQ